VNSLRYWLVTAAEAAAAVVVVIVWYEVLLHTLQPPYLMSDKPTITLGDHSECKILYSKYAKRTMQNISTQYTRRSQLHT